MHKIIYQKNKFDILKICNAFEGFKYRNVKVVFLLKHLDLLVLKCVLFELQCYQKFVLLGGITVLGKQACIFTHQCRFCTQKNPGLFF